MRLSFSVSSAVLLIHCSAALPTATSLATEAAITTPLAATHTPWRRNDDFEPSITPFSLTLPTLSIAEPSIPSLSLDLPPATCTPGSVSFAEPDPHGHVPADACNALWNYSPSFAAAVAFSVLFGILTLVHLAQAVIHRNGFCWVITMAALWETGAYVSRAFGSQNQQSSPIATVAQILVLVAPIWVNAFAYMVFARIVHFYSPTRKVWFLSPSSLALIFVTLDIVSFITQLIGGGMAGPGATPESQRKGLDIYMGGIGMQEGFIVVFLGLVVKFHRDQLHAERVGRLSGERVGGWRWLIWALYGCLLAITIRIVYRLVEFSAGLGASNPLPGNEALLYVVESTPMWFAILVWNAFHPGRFMHGAAAKLPPSWLSRHLCCCCHRKRLANSAFDGTGSDHQRLTDEQEAEDDHEMRAMSSHVRGRAHAAPTNPFLDAMSCNSSPSNDSHERVRLRPAPAVDHDRHVSPDPPVYSAYRPR